MNDRGHNERSYRLDELVSAAQVGLGRIDQGEEFTISGWLAYGEALNEGRSLFPSNEQFGQWVEKSGLCQVATNGLEREIDRHERAAAMWAAANFEQFDQARNRGNPRTIRGIHAKWKEIEAEQEALEHKQAQDAARAKEAEQRAKDEAEAREAAQSAPTEEARVEAKARLADAITARNQAEYTAREEVEALDAAAGGPKLDQNRDPDEKLRAQFRKLTPEAQEDEWLGLRADLSDEKAKRIAAEAEAKALKGQLRDFQGDDKDEVIRRLQASVKQAENAKWKALEDRDAFNRQLFAVKKERDAAIAKLQVGGAAT